MPIYCGARLRCHVPRPQHRQCRCDELPAPLPCIIDRVDAKGTQLGTLTAGVQDASVPAE